MADLGGASLNGRTLPVEVTTDLPIHQESKQKQDDHRAEHDGLTPPRQAGRRLPVSARRLFQLRALELFLRGRPRLICRGRGSGRCLPAVNLQDFQPGFTDFYPVAGAELAAFDAGRIQKAAVSRPLVTKVELPIFAFDGCMQARGHRIDRDDFRIQLSAYP